MGRIDSETKEYVKRPEVFADLFNHLIYEGREVIKPDALSELDTTATFIPFDEKGKAFPVQKYRDVLKNAVVMEDANAAYALILGIENQTGTHYAMPVRNMGYDAYNYAAQVTAIARNNRKNAADETSTEFLSGFKKGDKILPVITLVVYFGLKPWDGPISIYEMLATKEERILKYVPNYKMNLIAPISMSDEEVDRFRSNFRELAAYIKRVNDKQALYELTQDERFKHIDPLVANIANDVTNSRLKIEVNEKGEVDMCVAIVGIREDGKIEGRAEGRAEGKTEGKIETAKKMIALGKLTFEEIAECTDLSIEKIKELAVAKTA